MQGPTLNDPLSSPVVPGPEPEVLAPFVDVSSLATARKPSLAQEKWMSLKGSPACRRDLEPQ